MHSLMKPNLVFFFEGDLKEKLKKGKLNLNNSKMIGNSFTGNYSDNRIENEYYSQHEDDKESTVSYGSHRKRGYKEDSHKGSLETFDGEEKKDASKEDFDIGEGDYYFIFTL